MSSLSTEPGAAAADPLDEITPDQWASAGPTLAEVMPAVIRAFAGTDGDRLGLPDSRNVVVLLIDGLGATLLEEHPEIAPTLTRLRTGTLRAGFPATTATSLASLTVGEPAGEHGIVGYSFRPDRGHHPGRWRPLLNTLRWSLDDAHGPSALAMYPPGDIQTAPTAFEQIAQAGATVTYVMPGEYEGSGLTQAIYRAPGRYLPAVTTEEIGRHVTLALDGAGRHFVYAYYPKLDAIGHFHAPGSDRWIDELRVVDALVADLADRLPSETTLLVTGDHGMVAAGEAVDIDAHPDLTDSAALIAGEARVRHAYALPGDAETLRQAWTEILGDRAHVASREEAIAGGWFGPSVTAAAAARIGDVVAVARGRTVLTLPGAEQIESTLAGHHGAWTRAEQLIPLVVATG